jgi:hypothetical protein
VTDQQSAAPDTEPLRGLVAVDEPPIPAFVRLGLKDEGVSVL